MLKPAMLFIVYIREKCSQNVQSNIITSVQQNTPQIHTNMHTMFVKKYNLGWKYL